MKACDFYALAHAAYNGSDDARFTWFEMLSPIAVRFGKVYQVLPSLIMAKAAIETGYGSDLYEEVLEDRYGIKMEGKAQNHNNILCVNGFSENRKYLDELPLPRWMSYRAEFGDYGTHVGADGKIYVKTEPWKDYETVDDCIEDWCANIRYQARNHGKFWGGNIREQLLAIESFTPEGAAAKSKGMHFEWQDQILALYEKFRLYTYDLEAMPMPEIPITEATLDAHIKAAYTYAHRFCKYGPTDIFFPPAENGQIDCCGIVFRAFYTMGHLDHALNIDQTIDLCERNGLIRTEDEEEAARHHSIVCMCPKGDRRHVAHVFYSLGGKSALHIDKYDLGSQARINATQPFENVPVNEWPDRRDFLCAYYPREEAAFKGKTLFRATTKKAVKLQKIAGKGNATYGTVPKGASVAVIAAVSTTLVNRWFFVEYCGEYGFVYAGYLRYNAYKIPKTAKTVKAPDGFLNCRVGGGLGYPISNLCPSLKNGSKVRILNVVESSDGTKWVNVYRKGLVYFVSEAWLI